MMNVLFQSYADFGRMYGGGPTVVYSLAKELTALGVSISFHDYWRDDPKSFDIVHYFSCIDANTWLRHRPDDPPLVVTPITWWSFSRRKRVERDLKHFFRVIRHRTTNRRALGDPFTVPTMFFPNCNGEATHFGDWCNVSPERMTVVPHGVSADFESGDSSLFEEIYGLRDFVLCVGRFESPRKNQLTLVRAMKNVDIPVVFIGGPDLGHEPFYDQCVSEGGRRTIFLGPMQSNDPLFRSAFHAAKVLVMPALLESPGLTGMEAALAGANLAVTTGGSTREHFGDLAWYFDPRNEEQMRSAIIKAVEAPRNSALRDRVRQLYTWDKIAKVQLEAYQRVLATKKAG